MKVLQQDQVEILLARCVGVLEGVYLAKKPINDAVRQKIRKLLETVYPATGLEPAPGIEHKTNLP